MATTPTGKFVWFDYVSKDEKKAQAFFGELFNWKPKVMPMGQGSYTMIEVGSDTIGGYMHTPPGAPDHAHWLSYLGVADVKESAAKVKASGGTIGKEPYKVGEVGTMAVVFDPFHGVFALWQPNQAQDSGDYKGTAGSFIWNELYTEDPDRSVAFYKAVGGFESETMTMGGGGPGPDRYEILKSDGKGRAGVMKMPGMPQNWMPYVQVASTDATVARATKLGATIKMPGETVPGVGRLAVFLDPLGAPLGILQPDPTM